MWCNYEKSACEDETICNAFSSRGIFKIRSDEPVQRYPHLNAMIQNQKIVVAIDESLALLEDDTDLKPSFLTFSAAIEVFAMSNPGNLILCGLNDGVIHGIFVKGIPIFHLCVEPEDINLNGKTFTSVQQLENRFFFICSNGSVYCLCEIDETPLNDFLNVSINGLETCGINENILDPVTLKRLYTGSGLKDISDAILSINCSDLCKNSTVPLFIGGALNMIYFRRTMQEKIEINLPNNFGGLKRIYNLNNFILVLTNSGHLVPLCPVTKSALIPENNNEIVQLIDDAVVRECNEENIDLLVLTKPDNDGARSIRMISYPSMKCLSTLDVPENAWLVQQSKCSVNLYYMCAKSVNVENLPIELEMVLVSETHPSERFKNLIAKHRFDEAEEFGKQFELSLQPIFEAKAKRLLLDLLSLEDNNPEMLEKHFAALLEIFKKIESKVFFVNNRLVSLPTRKILERFLNEILTHLDEEEDEADILDINQQIHRIETASLIDPYECNMDWQTFVYQGNLMKMLIKLLKTDMPAACVVWKRHSCAIINKLDETELQSLMSTIPPDVDHLHLLQWLRLFVPTVSNTHPNIMTFITDWSIGKTRILQYTNNWPENGLEFLTKVAETFEEIEFIHSHVSRQFEQNVGKLRDLVNVLQDLTVLKKSYNLLITLDNYLQDSMENSATLLLKMVHIENLKSLILNFLYPIFQEKGKSPVKVICNYISILVCSRTIVSTWLTRAVSCIELLHNEDEHLECSLLVLRNAPVPWPETVTPLVKLRNSTHPLALKIKTEYEVQVIKIMKIKYGWLPDNAPNANLNLLMSRIVSMDLPDMISDIHILAKAAPTIARNAYFNCCFEMVRKGKPEISYDLFKSLENNKNGKYASDIIELFFETLEKSIIIDDDEQIEEQKNLIEYLKLITSKTDSISLLRIRVIQQRFDLLHKFNLKVKNIKYLKSSEYLLKLMEEGTQFIIDHCKNIDYVLNYIWTKSKDLADALDMQHISVVYKICQRMQLLPLTCALAFMVLGSIECKIANKDEFIFLAIEVLCQQIIWVKNPQTSSISPLSNENDPLAYPLTYELLLKASLIEENQRNALIELIKYIQIVRNSYELGIINIYYDGKEREISENLHKILVRENVENIDESFEIGTITQKSRKHRISTSVFDIIELPAKSKIEKPLTNNQMPVVKFVSNTLLLMIMSSELKNCFLQNLKHILPDNIKDYEKVHEDFFSSFEYLLKTKVHDVWYIIAQYLLEYQAINNCKMLNADLVSTQLNRLFVNVMAHKDVNFTDLFSMVVAEADHTILLSKLGRKLKTDQQKIHFLTLLEMYSVYCNAEDVEAMNSRRLKQFYYMEFLKQDPSIKGKFNVDTDNVDKLLKELHNMKLEVNLLERMSRDFKLDYQKLLITQIINILSAQELQYEIKIDSFGKEELMMISCVANITTLCKPYLIEVQNTELLSSKLKQFINKINIYFYELYLAVIELLQFIGDVQEEMKVWANILHFLKHKMISHRRNRPSQLETEVWLQSQTEISVLPKIANFRLPFKPIVEKPLNEILDNELSVDNCDSWFPLMEMHTILKGSRDFNKNRDHFCMSAVKNSIADYKSKNNSKTWHLNPTNNVFLKSIIRLVKYVHNPCKAFSIFYFVSNYAPDGADQVEASFECYKFAMDNIDYISNSKHQELLEKIKRKYPVLKTQHMLHTYGLNDEKFLCLVDNPYELINSLYNHESILKTSKLDINAVAKEIAQLHNLDIQKIQHSLLHKWLSFTINATDESALEESIYEEQNSISENTNEGDAAQNVIRANYILNSWSKKDKLQFLAANIYPPVGRINLRKQLQMYECFTKLNDGSASFHNMLTQRQYIIIKCVHELKQLGYNSSVEKFTECNKIEILKILWRRNDQNPCSTLQLMANICLGFDIYLPKIWNGILKRMIMCGMVREVNALVEVLSCKPQLLSTEGLAQAWEYVLKFPFKNANQTRNVQQEEILQKTLFRLQSCPVLHKIDLFSFAEQCMRLKRPHMVAVLIGLSKNENQRNQIKNLVNMRLEKSEKIRQEILDLEEAGILSSILNFALKELCL